MKRLSKVKIEWSANFAYAIGLITTDGNLSINGRSINFTTKDYDLAVTFKTCLNIDNKMSRKGNGSNKIKKYFFVQFGDKNFYEFLVSIGLMPAKSKKLKNLKIPAEYFVDFLRGCIDGDGNIRVCRHSESKYPQLKLRLFSASPIFLKWIHDEIKKHIVINGGWMEYYNRAYILNYAKTDARRILKFIYYDGKVARLYRKYLIARPFLADI